MSITYFTKYHDLRDGDGTIDVAECLELGISVSTHDEVLLYINESLLITPQADHVGIGNNTLRKVPNRIFKGGRKKEHLALSVLFDANALVFVSLGIHHSRQTTLHADPPTRCHPFALTSVSPDGIQEFDVWAELAHLLNHLPSLQRQFKEGIKNVLPKPQTHTLMVHMQSTTSKLAPAGDVGWHPLC
uniref:Uncharacterized protein n=1 Tax=Eptatretus burgeri TaxID=7764 RepID=A0A8C4QAB4_EPTBU